MSIALRGRKMIRTIAIASAKGGVGKTTVAVNLGAAFTSLRKKTIILDADVKMSGLSLQLGLYSFPVTLNDVLNNNISILDALYIHHTGLRIIPASLYSGNIDFSNLEGALNTPLLDENVIFVDSPPGLDERSLAIFRACRETIFVTSPELPSVVDMMKTINFIQTTNSKPIGIIVNKYRKNDSHQLSLKEIESACGLPVIGAVPEDGCIRKGIFKRTPGFFLDPFSPSSIEFKKIVASLVGEEVQVPRFPFIKRLMRRKE